MANQKPLIGEVDVRALLESLTFDDENVNAAVLEQASLFMQAANYRVTKMRDRQEAESRLESLRATISIKIRTKNKPDPKAKGRGITEGNIKELVERDTEFSAAKQAMDKAERMEEWSKLLLEAFRMRRDSLRIIATFSFAEDNMRIGSVAKEKDRLKRELLKEKVGKRDAEEDV